MSGPPVGPATGGFCFRSDRDSIMSAMALAPYAMRDEDTRGRRFAEPAHPYRSDYQRDRDRILHTKAFRRLENKTQVFDPNYSDHFRNRLTHTLEVSQIARTICQALDLNTDLCEVLALSHDIGHPPFSHEGERVLNDLMSAHGSGFDHNLHALRIVEYFEEKYAAFRGLNLTFEVREGIVKHSRDYGEGEQSYIDLGEYLLGKRPPLEAQLIDLADEIAYNTADLDDGFDSNLLAIEQISSEVNLFRRHFHDVCSLYPDRPGKLLFSETIRRLIDTLVTGLIEHSLEGLKAAEIGSVEEVRQAPSRLIAFDRCLEGENRELKAFLQQHLYQHPALRAGRRRAGVMLERLFEFYLRHPEKLPPSHFQQLSELEPQRVVCDYIAGMTDPYARDRYAELFADDISR